MTLIKTMKLLFPSLILLAGCAHVSAQYAPPCTYAGGDCTTMSTGIPNTTTVLKGDGHGRATPVLGNPTDCVKANGTTGPCGSGSGAHIPPTSSVLRGDGSGNATPVAGASTNCVKVDGTSTACSSGGSIPTTTVILKGDGAGNASPVSGTATNCVHVDASTAPCISSAPTVPATTSVLKGDGSGNASAVAGTGTNCVQVNGSSVACSGAVTLNTPAKISKGSSSTALTDASPDVDYQTAIYKNVKTCGAVGDGSTDDHAAINACITSLSSGGTVVFPPGTYNVGTAGILLNTSGVNLLCASSRKCTLSTPSLTTNPVITMGSYSGALFYNTIEGFMISPFPGTGATGIHAITTWHTRLVDTSIQFNDNGLTNVNLETGLWLDGGNDGVIGTFGTDFTGINVVIGGSFIEGVRNVPKDLTFTNAYTAVHFINGAVDSNSTQRATANIAISGATNATPIVLTVPTLSSYYVVGQRYFADVNSVGGNTAANGLWDAQIVDSTHVKLMSAIGNGAYTSGGTLQFSAVGYHVETGGELHTTSDVEGMDIGFGINANYVGCLDPRAENLNNLYVIEQVDQVCFAGVSASNGGTDRGQHTQIYGGTSPVIPGPTLTNSPIVTGASDGTIAYIRMRQFAHQTTDDIHIRDDGFGNMSILEGTGAAQAHVGLNVQSNLYTPASSGEGCTTGAVNWDAGFVYVCTAPTVWKRAALSTF